MFFFFLKKGSSLLFRGNSAEEVNVMLELHFLHTHLVIKDDSDSKLFRINNILEYTVCVVCTAVFI